MDLSNIIAVRPNKTIYRDGDYTIKLMHEEYNASDVLNEALNLSIVHEIGFHVPQLYEVTKIDGKWAIIFEYIEGKALSDMIAENPGDFDKYFERFVDIQIEMHTYSGERLRHLTEKMTDKINISGLDATSRYDLHMRLDGLPKDNKLCHGDFTPGNIIITPSDKAYVIDWSHATQGNPAADAARTYLRFYLGGHYDQAEKYIKLFCKKSDTAKQNVQKWLAIVATSQLVKKKSVEREFLLSWANIFDFE